MPIQTDEARIFLAIEAIRTNKKMSMRRAAKTYNVPFSSLRNRITGRVAKAEKRHSQHKLTESEEETVVRHVLDLDSRGFPPRIEGVEDMANLLLTTRGGKRVGKNWAYRFVQRRPELKTRFSRAYDFQRALCEDPNLIKKWFELVKNMRAKYGIQDCDFYNFDETGFMMGVICAAMVVTRADRRGRGKQLQSGNREWATAIECVSSDGFVVPPFLIVQGKNHLASWYEGTDLPLPWVIKPSPNGWTDNNTAMDWIRHFDKYTIVRRKGAYRMIVLDGHESHLSIEFEEYCKKKNIITLCLPAHSSHLTQPLDIGCFSVLKRSYGKQLEAFIRAHINHITKPEFFIAFTAAHKATITPENIMAGFRGAGLVPYDPEAVLSKLDVKLRTPTPTGPPSADASPWVSQTPHTAAEAVSQSQLVQKRISNHQGSSPTMMFDAVKQLAKGTEAIAYEMTLLRAELRTTQAANKALAKRRRAKRTRLQEGGALSVEDARGLMAKKDSGHQKKGKEVEKEGLSQAGPATVRYCGRCAKPGHNVRTCLMSEESSDEDSEIDAD